MFGKLLKLSNLYNDAINFSGTPKIYFMESNLWTGIRWYEDTGIYYYEMQLFYDKNIYSASMSFTKVRISDENVTILWIL